MNYQNNSEFVYQKNFNKLIICRRDYYTPTMQSFLADPDSYLENSTKFFKNLIPKDNTAIGVINIDNHSLVVKRYNVKNFWRAFKIIFRSSRAMTSWKNAYLLKHWQIPTVEPVAVIENRYGFIRNKAYFIMKYVEGVRACEFLERPELFTQSIPIILSLAEIIKKMKSAYIRHSDLHHSNILVENAQPLLIDLDHMKQYKFFKWRFRKAHRKDLSRFTHYFLENHEARKLFQKHYFEDKV